MNAGLTFVGNLAFPRLSHRLRWHSRLGPRGTLVYVACWIAFCVLFILGAKRMGEWQETQRAKLREQLGREPTDEELFEYFQAQSED